MSYSVSVPFKNNEDKEKMKSFLSIHFKSLKTLVERTIYRRKSFNVTETPHEDFSYHPGADVPVLGFDYGPNTTAEERSYFYVICAWIAVHNGDRKKFDNTKVCSYILYDGDDQWPIFINKKPDKYNGDFIVTNENGYRDNPDIKLFKNNNKLFKLMNNKHMTMLTTIDSLIEKELQRLTIEWKNFNK